MYSERESKYVIFVGAGASAAEGAPLQSRLFIDYFSQPRRGTGYFREMDSELDTFFQLLFGIDTFEENLEQVAFPTFEEALGILDLAVQRTEGFKHYALESMATNSDRIRQLRIYLVFCMAKAIADGLAGTGTLHRQLIDNLEKAGIVAETGFITTNYDILVDNALVHVSGAATAGLPDYGLSFKNPTFSDYPGSLETGIPLMKIHGSLNWLQCPTCSDLAITVTEKGALRIVENIETAICQRCDSLLAPVVVPPTFFKDLSNPFLSMVWLRTVQLVREAEHLVFCGYSFPDADIHVKYLLKRAETNRETPLKITVINNHGGKAPGIAQQEKLRYDRFFRSPVNYTDLSFEQFSNNPRSILNT